MAVQAVAGGQALDWFREGWELFRREALNCVIVTIAWFVLNALLGLVPLVGPLLVVLITPALWAGLLACARASELGFPVGVDTFLSPLTTWRLRRPMLMLGGLLLAAHVGLVVIAFLVAGGSFATAIAGVATGNIAAVGGASLVAVLIVLAAVAVIGMAFLYAPMIVFMSMGATDPVAALKESFQACLANAVPHTVAALLLIPLTFLAVLPAGLGLAILLPVTAGAVWVSYKRIFAPPAPA